MSVVVVTIRETLTRPADQVDTVAFSDWEKAHACIESQTNEKAKALQLHRDSDVEGWFVQIDGGNQTIQYDAKELVVQ